MRFTYHKRKFLNPVSTRHTSYIYAEVESSNQGDYKYGNYILSLADCHRQIEFEFVLGTSQQRRQSLAKIDLLIETLTDFRSALAKEAQLIDQASTKRKKKDAGQNILRKAEAK